MRPYCTIILFYFIFLIAMLGTSIKKKKKSMLWMENNYNNDFDDM